MWADVVPLAADGIRLPLLLVADRLLAYRDALQANELSVRMHWIGMPFAHYRESVALFAERVIPALREASR